MLSVQILLLRLIAFDVLASQWLSHPAIGTGGRNVN